MENEEITFINDKTKQMVEHKEQTALSVNTRDAEIIQKNMEAINKIATTIKQSLIDGVDYGQIPGTDKPSLFKSGAEKIAQLFGLFGSYEILEKTIDKENGEIKYQFKCVLSTIDGVKIAEGFGVCTTQEKKYKSQNPWDIENTIMKMAKKRSLVDAAISVGVLSEVFTQDVEDLPLSTKASGGAVLRKNDILGLYTLIYALFVDFEDKFKDKDNFKLAVKKFIPQLLKMANITTPTLQMFTAKDKKTLLDYVNVVDNMEAIKNEFRNTFSKRNTN